MYTKTTFDLITLMVDVKKESTWYLDLGASKHVTWNPHTLNTMRKIVDLTIIKSTTNHFHVIETKKNVLDGWKHTKPPQNYNHTYNFSTINFFGNVWTSHFGLFFLVLSIFD